MPSALINIQILLDILLPFAGILFAILIPVVGPNIVYKIKPIGRKPKIRHPIFWKLFYLSAAIITISGIFSALELTQFENGNESTTGDQPPSPSSRIRVLDLDGYCQANGWIYSEPLDFYDAYSWVCRGNKEDTKINMDLACLWQYGTAISAAALVSERDSYSWTCYPK